MLFVILGLGIAALLALGASRLRISAWWILAPAAAALALLLALSPAESSCEGSGALGWTYDIAILVGLVSCPLAALTAFVDAIRTAEARRLLPVGAAALLFIAGFLIVANTVGDCLS
jgi:hypothetical protein